MPGATGALQNRAHARMDARGCNANALARWAERVHTEISVDQSRDALVHRHACPLGRSPLGRGQDATKDDESDGSFEDGSEHVLLRERSEGVSAALELLVAFLGGGKPSPFGISRKLEGADLFLPNPLFLFTESGFPLSSRDDVHRLIVVRSPGHRPPRRLEATRPTL